MRNVFGLIAQARREFGDRHIIIQGVLVVVFVGGWVELGVIAR